MTAPKKSSREAELEAQVAQLQAEAVRRDREEALRICTEAAAQVARSLPPEVSELGPGRGGLAIPIGPQADPQAPEELGRWKRQGRRR